MKAPILVIRPETVNYFYELQAIRLHDALRDMGHPVALARLDTFDIQDYSLCLLVNVAEIVQGFLSARRGTLDDAVTRFGHLRNCCPRRFLVLMECVKTQWYSDNMQWCQGLGIDSMIDLGFHTQQNALKSNVRRHYHFLFNGLTAQERLHIHDAHLIPKERPVPWVFIGTFSKKRANLAERLVNEVDSRGILYLRNPESAPIGWNGPHFNYEQFLKVHQASQYSVWCAHHDYLYLESERFRVAVLTGAIPLKVLLQHTEAHRDLPFSYLLLNEQDFTQRMAEMNYDELWHRFRDEYMHLPSLETGLDDLWESAVYG